jgi:hypothetical protein
MFEEATPDDIEKAMKLLLGVRAGRAPVDLTMIKARGGSKVNATFTGFTSNVSPKWVDADDRAKVTIDASKVRIKVPSDEEKAQKSLEELTWQVEAMAQHPKDFSGFKKAAETLRVLVPAAVDLYTKLPAPFRHSLGLP